MQATSELVSQLEHPAIDVRELRKCPTHGRCERG